ncbi:specificity protein transcription factor 2-like isoform X2 [Anopheles moucheti]|uniref:specificity protein transcription factor 2-like isoform X2 n=1 Tax=Anopheles moucheti TaxID=186751 RepID=UPI0022F04CC6|nr:specificity protein transcription factor 2-like isoform X2 [Anopheles moucheti]
MDDEIVKEEYSITEETPATEESSDAEAKQMEDEATSSTRSKDIEARVRVPRRKCTCYYCEVDTGEDRKNQHICHVSDCKRVFRKPWSLRVHIRSHMGERPYTCSWTNCGTRFTRKEQMVRHMLLHTGEKPHKCNQCEKKFGRKDHLQKHMENMHNKVKRDKNDSGSDHSEASDSNKSNSNE